MESSDFCSVSDLQRMKEKLQSWLEIPGPGLLEWQTKLLAPWEAGAIQGPAMPPATKPAKPSREP